MEKGILGSSIVNIAQSILKDLCAHLETDLHKNITGQEGYYEGVDTLIKSMPSLKEFVEQLRKNKRPEHK